MDTPLADRIQAHDVLPSLQEQMAKTGEKQALPVDSNGISVSTETLTHMAGLLDWATTFDGSQGEHRVLLFCQQDGCPWHVFPNPGSESYRALPVHFIHGSGIVMFVEDPPHPFVSQLENELLCTRLLMAVFAMLVFFKFCQEIPSLLDLRSQGQLIWAFLL